MEQICSRTLFWLFQLNRSTALPLKPFQWIKLPVVPYFRILDGINPQSYFISEFSMKQIPSRTLLPYIK